MVSSQPVYSVQVAGQAQKRRPFSVLSALSAFFVVASGFFHTACNIGALLANLLMEYEMIVGDQSEDLPGARVLPAPEGKSTRNSETRKEETMRRKRIIALLALLGIVAVVLASPWRSAARVPAPNCWWKPPFKPSGTYIGLLGTPYRWIFTIIPGDPSGNTFTAIFEYAEDEEDFTRTNDVFTAVRTGRNSYDMTSVHYQTEGGPFTEGEVVAIVVTSGPVTFSEGGDIMTFSGAFATFLPEQDADMDGFPDDGQEPVFCFESGPVQGKRLHVIPPYPPTVP
jgi:hypothetical protein